jgi:hypothetical protein
VTPTAAETAPAKACKCCIRRYARGVATVTHRIADELKAELERFCEEHGLKQQAVVQEAIAAWLEDAQDAELIDERRGGPWTDWDDVKDDL